MNTELFFEKSAALQESNTQVQELINRLANIEFQPGSVPLLDYGGDYENNDGVLSELVAEILQMIKEQEEDLELLKEEIHDLNPGRSDVLLIRQQEELNVQVQLTIAELKTHHKSFQRAQLSAKRRLEMARTQERVALTQSYLEYAQIYSDSTNLSSSPLTFTELENHPLKKNRQQRPLLSLSNEEKEINAASEVITVLRRTHNLMANELSRSQFANDTLKGSTEALAQLAQTYSTLDTLLLTSRNLVGTLLRTQKSDTWYLETAFYILLSTICWLVFRRLLYGPLLWFLWYPIKIVVKTTSRVLSLT
ncbi:putative sec20 domain-containing protein [Erysiphe necator]|uniref:Putative sec20 domain-containing protein n=1 Tax=Uncinula necator TaxID=52586 RepID=A0A0B1P8H2_UNCNE|nr:putative sec20 domain-containing protein [Erysiphe necator]